MWSGTVNSKSYVPPSPVASPTRMLAPGFIFMSSQPPPGGAILLGSKSTMEMFFQTTLLLPCVKSYILVVLTTKGSSCDSNLAARQKWCGWSRSEEHTSELQSRENLVCRLLLEKK